jgi:hypothetical protein
MGVKVSPPSASSVVEIDAALVERYTQQGWTLVEKPAPVEPKKQGRPAKSGADKK